MGGSEAAAGGEPLRGCQAAYTKGEVCGHGAFGTVRRAVRVADGATVAVKKVRGEARCSGHTGTGGDLLELREVRVLRYLSEHCAHENVIVLLDSFIHKGDRVKLIFEYKETNLDLLLESSHYTITAADAKLLAQMLLRGVAHLHSQGVLHRDLKPNNLLIGADGVLQIADFGRARYFPGGFSTSEPVDTRGGSTVDSDTPSSLTPQMVTACYRAPELLLGARTYGPGIDTWACACILADIALCAQKGSTDSGGAASRAAGPEEYIGTAAPFFSVQYGQRLHSDLLQFDRLISIIGVPDDHYASALDDMGELPSLASCMVSARPAAPSTLPDYFPTTTKGSLGAGFLALLTRMFEFSPTRRLSAACALETTYFESEAPPPSTTMTFARRIQRMLNAPSDSNLSHSAEKDWGVMRTGAVGRALVFSPGDANSEDPASDCRVQKLGDLFINSADKLPAARARSSGLAGRGRLLFGSPGGADGLAQGSPVVPSEVLGSAVTCDESPATFNFTRGERCPPGAAQRPGDTGSTGKRSRRDGSEEERRAARVHTSA